jgi:hypothetical protein
LQKSIFVWLLECVSLGVSSVMMTSAKRNERNAVTTSHSAESVVTQIVLFERFILTICLINLLWNCVNSECLEMKFWDWDITSFLQCTLTSYVIGWIPEALLQTMSSCLTVFLDPILTLNVKCLYISHRSASKESIIRVCHYQVGFIFW